MSFTDQRPFTATADQVKMKWGGGFHCKLCGHKFGEGDVVRWVYANGTPGAGCRNFLVCHGCDGPDVLERGAEDFRRVVAGAKRWGIRWGASS